MVKTLPYLTTPGNIPKVLERIKSASTPERVTRDFVQTKLQIPGGSGGEMVPFLKKIGFVNSDGTPSTIYKRFRNAATSRSAIADAIKHGYAPLYERNEYTHDLSDQKLRGLIIEDTGCEDDARALDMTVSCIKQLKQLADFDTPTPPDQLSNKELPLPTHSHQITVPPPNTNTRKVGMNLSYTINLNLPATSDISVFNAIFKSLKDYLIADSNEDT